MTKGTDMEKIISLMGQIFQDDVSEDAFWQNAGVLFDRKEALQEEQTDLLFQSLADMLSDNELTNNEAGMAKLFIFLGGLAHAAQRRQSEHLWLDKALIYTQSQ